MPLDPKAQRFLGGPGAPVKEIPGQTSKLAEQRIADFRIREIVSRSNHFYEDLLGFFLEQRKTHQYPDEESIAAVALFTINLREAFGSPQNAAEKQSWTPEKRAARLAEFDRICEEMQQYYDSENT